MPFLSTGVMKIFLPWQGELKRSLKTYPLKNITFYLIIRQHRIRVNNSNSVFILSAQPLQLFVITIVETFSAFFYARRNLVDFVKFVFRVTSIVEVWFPNNISVIFRSNGVVLGNFNNLRDNFAKPARILS